MRGIFHRKEIITIGLCILLWCFTTTSNWPINFRMPKWINQISNENLTNVPKSLIQLEHNILYPTRNFFQNFFSSPHQVKTARMLQRTQRLIPKSTKFFCDINGTRSLTRPTNVHELRPGDIDVIGGIGDSLTVATGSFSYTLPQLSVDHRGVSWTAGGQDSWREFLTVPNILKIFNPKLVGYAYGDSTAQHKFSQFNVAEIGALSRDVPYMTRELVKRIKMDKRVNVNEDWKMISIMMGSNTYCLELCYNEHSDFPEKHKESLLKSLLYIKENLPRTIVNLIISPNLEVLMNLKNLPLICFFTHIFECPCLFATQYKDKYPEYMKTLRRFQEVEKEVTENEELKNKDDFTVVSQPFTKHIQFPVNKFNTSDVTYLSSDCFHLSQKGYARAANGLWNNLLEPVGNKSTNWSKEFDRFLCPTEESPYIRTWKNSIV